MVTGMDEELFSLLGKVSHIEEFHVISVDADITDEITHFTIGSLIQVGKKTVFKLRVVNLFSVVSNLLVNGDSESGLVSKDILQLRLINRHTLLVGVVKLGALETISVLSGVVLFFTELGQFLLNSL
jgi:hypothetical protein